MKFRDILMKFRDSLMKFRDILMKFRDIFMFSVFSVLNRSFDVSSNVPSDTHRISVFSVISRAQSLL